MIEMFGLIYGIAKDVVGFLKYKEEDKVIEDAWLDQSGFRQHATNAGLQLRWTTPKKLETRRLDGWEIMYEIDKTRRIKRRLLQVGGSVLLGKRGT